MMPISDMPLGLFTAAGSLNPDHGGHDEAVKTSPSGLTQSTMVPSSYSLTNAEKFKRNAPILGPGSGSGAARKLSVIMMDKLNSVQGRMIFQVRKLHSPMNLQYRPKIGGAHF